MKDEDLSKAASLAAAAVTAPVVMKKLGSFGVSKVNDLKGGDREKFLAWAQAVAE